MSDKLKAAHSAQVPNSNIQAPINIQTSNFKPPEAALFGV
jgi:hypothetical protein